MWFPIVLLAQALSFYIPNGFWFYFGKQLDCNYLMDICYKASLEDNNKEKIGKIIERMQKYFNKKKITTKSFV